MKISFVILILFSTQIVAKEYSTEYFTISLDKRFIVEIDKTRRLIAFTSNVLSNPTFLTIDFTEERKIKELVPEINSFLSEFGGKLEEVECNQECISYYYEGERNTDNGVIFHYHKLVQTKSLTYIITYINDESLGKGRRFVNNINGQIEKSI